MIPSLEVIRFNASEILNDKEPALRALMTDKSVITKVIPRNKKVKSLKGNNGDFNMDDIFANNNNNDKSSFWT